MKCKHCGYAAANERNGVPTCDDCWLLPTTIEEALQKIQPGEWTRLSSGTYCQRGKDVAWRVGDRHINLQMGRSLAASKGDLSAWYWDFKDLPRTARALEAAAKAYSEAMK